MKPFNTSCFLLSALALLSISTANAGGCSSHSEKNVELECLSNEKKCIDVKEKDLLYKVEA